MIAVGTDAVNNKDDSGGLGGLVMKMIMMIEMAGATW